MKKLRALGIVTAVLLVTTAVASAGGDVILKLNGGDNVAYVGETNTIKIPDH